MQNADYNEVIKFSPIALFISCLVTMTFFFPSITSLGIKAGYLFIGDNFDLWIGQLHKLLILYNQNIYQGIDYSTHGGASEFFLRPNLILYNPFFLLIGKIFGVLSLHSIVFIMVLYYVLVSLVGYYYCFKVSNKILNFDKVSSFFVATGFIFSIYFVKNLLFVPFYWIVALFPAAIYFAIINELKFNILNSIKNSFVFSVIFLSGYFPISIACIFYAVIFIFFYHWQWEKNNIKDFFLAINKTMKSIMPIIIGSLIVLPHALAMMLYQIKVTEGIFSVQWCAHLLSNLPHQILLSLSSGIALNEPVYEQCLVIGVVSLIIIVLFICFNKIDDISENFKRILAISSAIFIFSVLATYGQYSVFSDILYYFVPLLGKMHVYQRSLAITNFFFILSLVIILNSFNKTSKSFLFGCKVLFVLILLSVGIFSYLIATKHLSDASVINENVLMELILALIFLGSLVCANKKTFIVVASICIFVPSLQVAYRYSDGNAVSYKIKNTTSADINNAMENSIYNYMISNINKPKAIIKYVDLVPKFDNNLISKNHNWFANHPINLSSYYGYEVHVGVPLDYRDKMKLAVKDGKYIFVPDIQWLEKTGIDYVIYKNDDEESLQMAKKIADLRDDSKIYKLIGNINIAPALFSKNSLDNLIFDNGYFRAYSKDKNARLDNFKFDNATKFKFSANSTKDIRIEYMFWHNDKLKLQVNKKSTEINTQDGLMSFVLKPGKSEVYLYYDNKLLLFFFIIYTIYISVFVLYGVYILYRISCYAIFLLKRKFINNIGKL